MAMTRMAALCCALALCLSACDQISLTEPDESAQSESGDAADVAEESSGEEAGAPEAGGGQAAEAESEDEDAESAGDSESADETEVDENPETDSDASLEMADEPTGSDMLSEEESLQALSSALQSEDLGGVVASAIDRDDPPELMVYSELADNRNYRVMYTQRHVDKYAQSRKAEVAVYRYDTREMSVSTVDLETGEVEALALPEGMPVPLVPAEIEEAADVARVDDAVIAALEAAGLDPETAAANGLLTVSTEPGARCAESRCLRLFFSDFENPVPAFSVVVDLNALQVVEVMDMPGAKSQGEDE